MREEANIQIEQFLDGKLLKVSMFGKTYNTVFSTARYKGGRIAIELIGEKDGEPFAMLTVNIPEVPLKEYEFLIKNWSENEDIAKAALASGFFIDTGKRVSSGFEQAPIWEIDPSFDL